MAAQPIVVPAPSTATPPRFPFLDLKKQFQGIGDEVMAAVTAVMASQRFILGPDVDTFEKEIATYVGSRYAIGCASGSDALLLALMAVGVSAGDEVITTPFTFVATAGSIARLGAVPVFVDIDPATYNLNPDGIEGAITAKTKAIMPVHLYGLCADMRAIMKIADRHNLPVIEDAAQAIGAELAGRRAGNMGTIGCFSFFPSKNLGCAGDGGMMTTNDERLANLLRSLRVHGSRHKYHCEVLGVNSRLDALQAAILHVKFAHLESWTALRQQHAEKYVSLFGEFGLEEHVIAPFVPFGFRHVFNQFVIRVRTRDELREYLQRAGIPTEIYYPEPLHLQPAFAYLDYPTGRLPQSEAASHHVLALPIFPELTEVQQTMVVSAIAEFYQRS